MSRRSRPTNFSQVASAKIRRSSFNRSFGYKTTFDSGLLIPFFCQEVLPGDTHTVTPHIFARLSTPIVPFMDNLKLRTFFFFVPNRLSWEHWQNFMGEQKNPGDSTDYIVPQASSQSSNSVGDLSDYFGIPTGVPNLSYTVLPLRDYWLIWNDWFRDQNLQDSCDVCLDDSGYVWSSDKSGFNKVNGVFSYQLARHCKYHDYFTSCLPWPQKGPGVEIPLTGDAHIIPERDSELTGAQFVGIYDPSGGPMYQLGNVSNIVRYQNTTNSSMTVPLIADLSSVSGATINTLRQAFQIQKLLERDARGGTRYVEILLSHFGVRSPDQRLQRPEYLGGGSAPIVVNPVQQTSATSQGSSTPQGNLAATGYVNYNQIGFNKSFVEHGYIIGLMCVDADLTYQQGLNRMWSRKTRYDYYWPVLACLGEQAVLNKEIYAQGTSVDDEVFGYQERWAEYRYQPSMITGKMRSTYAQSLDIWHLAEKFDALPKLNSDFIQSKPPIERVVAVTDEPQFICDVWFDYNCVRPMPVRSTPGLIDHF